MTNHSQGIVGSVLSPACRVWLKSQVSHVDELRVDIVGGSRQILGGTIGRVAVAARGAIYQGLTLGSIDSIAENIRINLPQVLKGQALRLLEPIAVTAKVEFSETDLQTSLASPLLSGAIADLFVQILDLNVQQSDWMIDWHRVQIVPQTLMLWGNLTTAGQTAPIAISMGIAIGAGQILLLDPLRIDCTLMDTDRQPDRYQIDLGNDVQIELLQLGAGKLLCSGRIQVNP